MTPLVGFLAALLALQAPQEARPQCATSAKALAANELALLPFASPMLLAGPSGPAVPAAQYWRLLILSNSNDTQWVGASEIEMAESTGGADVTSSTFAIGSNNGTFTDGAESNAFANDGSTTSWQYGNGAASSYHYGKWIGQNFGAGNNKSIREVRILPATTVGTTLGRFMLQYSSTGTDGSWTTVCGFKSIVWTAGVWQTFNVATPGTLAFGPERITDPGFDNAASWSASGGWSVSGSNAVGTNAASQLQQNNVFVNGSRYVAEWPYSATPNTGKLAVRTEANNFLYLTPALTATGYGNGMFIADGVNFKLEASVNVFNGTIPNLSVKEILNW